MKAQDIFDNAYCGIVGINEDLNVFGGYDERFESAGAEADRPDWLEPEHWKSMTKEEKHALADRMIAIWQRYKDFSK